MRIIAGTFGGRRFSPPKGLSARPTTDRAKEGLFNWLNHRMTLENLTFLDLFAGSGNISFELISRGGTGVAVERDRKATSFIEKTAGELPTDRLTVVTMDVNRYLNQLPTPFDLVFADPPYAINDPLSLVDQVTGSGWLKPGGLMILEHFNRVETLHKYRIDQRNYGQSVFSIFMMLVENKPKD